MLHIGCHLSPSGGLAAMGRDALRIGADTFQFFTRNPRGSRAKAIDEADAAALAALQAEHGFWPTVAHAPYTLNPCSSDARVREFAAMTMEDDLKRLNRLPCGLYNFHPGSHTGQGIEAGTRLTAALIAGMLSCVQSDTVLLIETMSGQGSEIGGTFEQVADLIDRAGGSERIGVCLDTCHVFAAGYDLKNDLDGVLEQFDRTIGLGRLRAVHLNDSMQPCGSHRDRHAPVGKGEIGFEALLAVTRHEALRNLPFVLETPQPDLAGYAAEIATLKGA
ncbi:MAG: deoxyribonuclease IV [Candidatus Aphodomorpha sp.]